LEGEEVAEEFLGVKTAVFGVLAGVQTVVELV
jgi:hypothetical protein